MAQSFKKFKETVRNDLSNDTKTLENDMEQLVQLDRWKTCLSGKIPTVQKPTFRNELPINSELSIESTPKFESRENSRFYSKPSKSEK